MENYEIEEWIKPKYVTLCIDFFVWFLFDVSFSAIKISRFLSEFLFLCFFVNNSPFQPALSLPFLPLCNIRRNIYYTPSAQQFAFDIWAQLTFYFFWRHKFFSSSIIPDIFVLLMYQTVVEGKSRKSSSFAPSHQDGRKIFLVLFLNLKVNIIAERIKVEKLREGIFNNSEEIYLLQSKSFPLTFELNWIWYFDVWLQYFQNSFC